MSKTSDSTSSDFEISTGRTYAPITLNRTSGSRASDASVLTAVEGDLTRSPRSLLTTLGDTGAARLAETLIGAIESAATELQERRVDAKVIPPVKAALIEGGGILLEWTSVAYRLGFAIHAEPLAADWFFIAVSKSGATSSSGEVAEKDVGAVARRFVEFMVSNS